jgi:DNA-binding HxlR family transcriptional regulator
VKKLKETALCPRLSKAMELVGKRWTALIIYQLLEGPQRFNAIEAALPISGRLLSERLKELEKEGIVERKVYSEVPIRVEYHLTEKGLSLEKVVREIEVWAKTWL